MIKKLIFGLVVILLCAGIGAAQSRRKKPVAKAVKSAVITYDSDGPEQGMYKWGTFYLKINGRIKLFLWGDKTRVDNSIYNNPNAYKNGAQWRITYADNPDKDSNADFYLLSAIFTGRIVK